MVSCCDLSIALDFYRPFSQFHSLAAYSFQILDAQLRGLFAWWFDDMVGGSPKRQKCCDHDLQALTFEKQNFVHWGAQKLDGRLHNCLFALYPHCTLCSFSLFKPQELWALSDFFRLRLIVFVCFAYLRSWYESHDEEISWWPVVSNKFYLCSGRSKDFPFWGVFFKCIVTTNQFVLKQGRHELRMDI